MSFYVREIPLGIRFLQKLTDTCCPRLHFNRDLWWVKNFDWYLIWSRKHSQCQCQIHAQPLITKQFVLTHLSEYKFVCSYRSSVLFLTYMAYMCYHMSRKPISVVKAVLHQNCSNLKPPDDVQPSNKGTWCDWAPFSEYLESFETNECSIHLFQTKEFTAAIVLTVCLQMVPMQVLLSC